MVSKFDLTMQQVSVTGYLLVVFHYTCLIGTVWFLGCLFSPFFLFAFGYMYWYYSTVDHAFKGGYNVRLLPDLMIWKYFRDYFSIRLYKTQDLDTNKNYIFGLHPAGVLNAGAMSVFGTNSSDFNRAFNGITPHLVTDQSRFYFPLTRELLLFSGVGADDPKTFDWILNNRGIWSNHGQAIVVPLGTKDELNEHNPERITLFIRSRTDFIRAAIKTGSSIVPVFQFGEKDLYSINPCPDGSCLRRVQEFFRNVTKLPLPFFGSHTGSKKCCGILPKSRALNMVFGRPIEVNKIEFPTEEQTQEVFGQYLLELENIFNENKARFLDNKNAVLIIQ